MGCVNKIWCKQKGNKRNYCPRYGFLCCSVAQVEKLWCQAQKVLDKMMEIYEQFRAWLHKRRLDTENKENLFLPRLSMKLDNFQFYHTASTSEYIDEKYIRRPNFEHKLKSWLTEKSGHGVYLITGHRGTGKSSLVGKVVRELKHEVGKGKYIDVCVNIGQDNINELHILHIVTKQIRETLFRKSRRWYRWFFYVEKNKWWLRGIIVALLLSNAGLHYIFPEFSVSYQSLAPIKIISFWIQGNVCIIVSLCLVALLSFILIVNRVYRFFWSYRSRFRIMERLSNLCSRFYAEHLMETSTSIGVKEKLEHSRRQVSAMPPVSMQELETELIQIFKDLKWKVIIVFDELDKVDPQEEYKEKENGQLDVSAARRQKILDMIANMKSFLSTARAYFIFIAGPELYDAAMADISDRDFAIGNLFNGILPVDSFYTKGDLSVAIALTEEFVCKQIAGVKTLGGLYEKNQDKIQIVFLYHFICYLAFISHGSPKKIAVFFEKYVRSYEYLKDQKQTYGINRRSKNTDWYLTFSDHQQLKINFVHYLTFPILQNIMNRSAIFGDKLRLAESFIFAHIVKLHNGGFSWRNIEQIPEIMAVNRAPEVREYIQAILKSMNQSRLSPILYGLYAYKFPMRMAEEISYFSKLSDELSALLNFSIGELQPIKEHYFAILDKLSAETERKNGGKSVDKDANIYTEASVRHALGDIYMQEENFSAAIQQFERCVELTTPLLLDAEQEESDDEQLQNYVLFCNRTMLKLGLAHEKRHTNNSAYVVYSDLCRILSAVRKNCPVVAPLFYNHRALHLGILARLYVLERMETIGIEGWHICEAINQFKALYAPLSSSSRPNPIIEADFHRKLGDILYYKNVECQYDGLIYSAKNEYIEGIKILLECGDKHGDNIRGYIYDIHSKITDKDKGHVAVFKEKDTIWLSCLTVLVESLGHALLANLQREDIEFSFPDLVCFINLVMKDFCNEKNDATKQKQEQNIPQMIPAWMMSLYCYWKSAELYDVLGDYRAEKRCYEQIMHLLEIYVSLHKNKVDLSDAAESIQKLLNFAVYVRSVQIKIVYALYEHTNILEKRMLLGWFGENSTKPFDYRYLSFYSDIEEIDYGYGRFVVACCKLKNNGEAVAELLNSIKGKVAEMMLQVIVRNRAHQNATLSTMINRHRLILQIYKFYLEDFFKRCGGKGGFESPLDVEPGIVERFIDLDSELGYVDVNTNMEGIAVVKTFLEQEKDKSGKSHDEGPCENFKNCKHFGQCKNFKKRDDFKNCKDCKECENCKRYGGYVIYKFRLLNEILQEAIQRSNEIMKRMVGPLQVTTLFNYTFQGNVYGNYGIFLKLYKQLEDYYNKHRELLKNHFHPIDFDKVRYADEDYLSERILQSYVKVQECHQHKRAYQDLIQQLYFLEDDFNNETIQFYLATERVTLPETEEKERKYSAHLFSQKVIWETFINHSIS